MKNILKKSAVILFVFAAAISSSVYAYSTSVSVVSKLETMDVEDEEIETRKSNAEEIDTDNNDDNEKNSKYFLLSDLKVNVKTLCETSDVIAFVDVTSDGVRWEENRLGGCGLSDMDTNVTAKRVWKGNVEEGASLKIHESAWLSNCEELSSRFSKGDRAVVFLFLSGEETYAMYDCLIEKTTMIFNNMAGSDGVAVDNSETTTYEALSGLIDKLAK